jgi:hypothetical protein
MRHEADPLSNSSDEFEAEPLRLFAFEADIGPSFRRFPMAARYRLDCCGLRLKLEDWQRLSRSERALLSTLCVDTVEQRDLYRQFSAKTLNSVGRTVDGVRAPAAVPPQVSSDEVPPEILDQCDFSGIPPLETKVWKRLDELSRYALVMLSRPGHANRGFVGLVAELLDSRDA